MCLLYKSPSDDTNKAEIEVPLVYTHVKRSHTHFKAPVVHARVRWITETPK